MTKPTPRVRLPYDRTRSVTQILGESKTQATNGNETDVNKIMERFTRTGIMPPPTSEPIYGDVTALQQDMTEVLETGRLAQIRLGELQKEADEIIQEREEYLAAQKKKLEEAQTNGADPQAPST